MNALLLFVPTLLCLMQGCIVSGEIFTAVVDMEGLITTELELTRHLENYIQAEELRLQRLRGYVLYLFIACYISLFYMTHIDRFLEEYESLYEEAAPNVGKYLANPINAYLLVKRLTSDWKQVEGVMTQNVGPGIFQIYLLFYYL
jgi:prolyl 4-hydroxylase